MGEHQSRAAADEEHAGVGVDAGQATDQEVAGAQLGRRLEVVRRERHRQTLACALPAQPTAQRT